MTFRVFLVDDEPLALKRLARLLKDTGRVEVVGSSSDPQEAMHEIQSAAIDVLFLDIQMPGMTGFELLSKLDRQPLVIFTTAYDEYALKAFEVNSIDYLLKPIEPQQLERAITKLEMIRGGQQVQPDVSGLLRQLSSALKSRPAQYPERLASRLGERVEFVEIDRVTHIFAKDKLTYASTPGKTYCLDSTITDLESKLDPKRFVRIHRSTIVNSAYVHELYSWFAGKMLLRLKDENRTELTVARDRVKALKEHLGI
jgi:two-component system LytT family response regulator